MKAPSGTTIIATPLANCWIENKLICVENVNCDRTIDNVQIHYKILKGIVGYERVCWLKSFPSCVEFENTIKHLAAAALPPMCRALAIVTASESTEPLKYSYKLLSEKGVPVRIFNDEPEARLWLSQCC